MPWAERFTYRTWSLSGFTEPPCRFKHPFLRRELDHLPDSELQVMFDHLTNCLSGLCPHMDCCLRMRLSSPNAVEETRQRIFDVTGVYVPVVSTINIAPIAPVVQQQTVVQHVQAPAQVQRVRHETHVYEPEPVIEHDHRRIVHTAGGGTYVESSTTTTGRGGQSTSKGKSRRSRRDSPDIEEYSSEDDRDRRSSKRTDRRMIKERSESRDLSRGYRRRRSRSRGEGKTHRRRRSRSSSRSPSRDRRSKRDDRRSRRRDDSDREDD